MAQITRNTTWPDFVKAMQGGGTVNFDNNLVLTYDLSAYFKPDNFAWVKVKSGTLINGNGAQVRVYANSLSKATTNNTPRLYVMIEDGNVTIDNLALHGRASFRITGSNVTLKNCTVDQSNRYSSFGNAVPYNRLDNMYGCFMIYGSGTRSNIEFNNCVAINADHMGFAVFTGSSSTTVQCTNIRYINCKAIGCGSGWEIGGHNPWGRGFDFQESKSPKIGVDSKGKPVYAQSTFTCTGCCAIDCLQSGFYLEGEYFPQNVSGTIENCHSENCGMRIANAAIAGRNLFDSIGNLGHAIPIPNKVYSSSPDVYGDGFYIPGNIVVKNCTAKNNIIGFTIGDGAYCVNCQDEGSFIGYQTDGGKLENCTSAKPKYFAAAVFNSLSGGSTLKVIDPPGTSRPLVLTNWVTIKSQRNIHPKSYKDLFVADGDVFTCEYSTDKKRYLKPTECNTDLKNRWDGYGTSSVGTLAIKVNVSGYDRTNAVKGHYTHASTPANSTVTYVAGLTYTKVSGCGGTYTPPPNPPTGCTPGDINCADRKICKGSAGNTAWTDITAADMAAFEQKCPDPDCPAGSTRVICIDSKEYKCSSGKKVATGNTCVGNVLGPYTGTLPVLQKGLMTRIYARDFGLGGSGVAYNDTTPTNEGGSDYRTDGVDSAGVDLVDWAAYPTRMTEPDTNKVVVSHTKMGDWLKYPISVVDNGTYTFTLRVSTNQNNCVVKVSVDGDVRTTINVPNTGKYETFQYATGTVIVPYICDDAVITLEFVGDMNLLWFGCEWLNTNGAKSLPGANTLPGASFTLSPTNPLIGQQIQFTDTSIRTPTQWFWDFGDGTGSRSQNPTHTYNVASVYEVYLIVTNASGSTKSAVTTVDVESVLIKPVTSFVLSTTSCKVGTTVQFTDTSTNTPNEWLWNFGDGETSLEQNPTHVYDIDGTYSVRLTSKNAAGSNTTSSVDILVTNLNPTVTIAANARSGYNPLEVQFTGTSSAIGTWLWNFGDGTTSTQQNPSHTYTTPGKYTVSAVVTADGNVGSVSMNNYIDVFELIDSNGGITKPPVSEMRQLPYFNVRNEYGYICTIDGVYYDTGGEGKAYHNVANSTPNTYRRGVDTLELIDHSVAVSTGEWIEYTVSVSTSGYYYFKINTKNTDPNAKMRVAVVNANGGVVSSLFDVNVPVSGTAYVDTLVKSDTLEKFPLQMSDSTTLRVTFTGNFLYKSMSIMSSDTVENKIASRSSITPTPDLKTVTADPSTNITIRPYQFDEGGQGISYMDRTEERFSRKAVRDSDVDLITVGRENGTETLINGTMKGEWVQYTIDNTTESEYRDVKLSIACSTTEPLSRINVVFMNELDNKTYDQYRNYYNAYLMDLPVVASFTEVQVLTIPIRVYKGKNIMRIYFDDNVTLGVMVFSA